MLLAALVRFRLEADGEHIVGVPKLKETLKIITVYVPEDIFID